MQYPESILIEYVNKLTTREDTNAFHALLECDDSQLNKLIELCEKESNIKRKAALVEIIWQHRNPLFIPFMGSMLNDPNPEVWKKALDGLVTMNSEESKQILIEAKQACLNSNDLKKAQWIEEAIEQIQETS